jgi:multidrug transporter EmrE-like cation transporter
MLKMKLKKPNLTKLIKAIIFIAISVMFLTVTFHKIEIDMSNYYSFHQQFYELFKPLIANYIFSGLFALLGILELKEAFSNGD